MADLRALTIRQPWASLIATGVKTIHTDKRRTSYRGPVLIHAGKHKPVVGDELGDSGWYWEWDFDHGIISNWRSYGEHPAPLGAVVAVADLTDCVPIVETDLSGRVPARPCVHVNPVTGSNMLGLWSSQDHPTGTGINWRPAGMTVRYIDAQRPLGDFTPGRWAWLLDNVRPIDPIPANGRQGLWRPDADLAAAVEEATR